MKLIQTYIHEAKREQLVVIAKAEGRTIAGQVRFIIDAFLNLRVCNAKKPAKTTRKKGGDK